MTDELNPLAMTLAKLLGLDASESPFPWQEHLLKRFLKCDETDDEGRRLPTALDIPTGLGKTSVIAIWAAARAANAAVPRRLVYVVDRRAVVDQATDEAMRVKEVVDDTPEVKRALGLMRPLPISTLRGQYVDNREWLEDPSSPAIIVGTVDMIGSRLLFEGYRCSRRMRPYHAGLLGADALIVLDEAHLVPAFEAMVRAALNGEELKPDRGNRNAVPRSRVMALSATGRGTSDTFRLDRADFEHPVVLRRLDAKKHVSIAAAVDVDALASTLASKAWEVADYGRRASRVIVFVDSRRTGQSVAAEIEKLAKGDGTAPKIGIEIVLLVGGRRVAERESAAAQLEKLGFIAGSKSRSENPVFVIATSAGEVGVDLDADHAVLDLVEWERMVQRLGRVNRRGDATDGASVWVVPALPDKKTIEALDKDEKIRRSRDVVIDESDQEESDDEGDARSPKKLKDDERERVRRWRRKEATQRALRSLPSASGALDASPRALDSFKRAQRKLVDEASTPPPLRPALTRAVVESWSMTSLEEHTGRPNVRPWLRGWIEEEAQTAIAWRRWLPQKGDAAEFFEAAPVETAEILETESTLVLDWLGKRVKEAAKACGQARRGVEAWKSDDSETVDTNIRSPLGHDEVVMFVLDDSLRGWTLGELDGFNRRERDDLLRDISGETVVVDARLGGLDQNGLLDSKSDDATDVSETTQLSFRVRELEGQQIEASSEDEGWRVESVVASRSNEDGEVVAWLVVETYTTQQSTTADGRSTGNEQRLDEHQTFAERHARAIGERLGLAPEHVNLLALAAVLHDEGKKAERWQRAFRAPKEKRPLGKTTSRPIQSILAGYRHELGSLPYAERDQRVTALSLEDRDLVLHLIAAHHGFARPILRTVGAEDAPPSALVERARAIALRFARLEKRWGPWGLAWWETLLRAADQGASRENDARGRKHG